MLNTFMIYGHGIDLVHLHRFYEMDDSRIQKLANRILTTAEYNVFSELKFHQKTDHLAKMWAAKEAISKAFKTGIRDDVVWKNMQIQNDTMGSPGVTLLNELSTNNVVCHLSISHDGDYVMASVILEKENAL